MRGGAGNVARRSQRREHGSRATDDQVASNEDRQPPPSTRSVDRRSARAFRSDRSAAVTAGRERNDEQRQKPERWTSRARGPETAGRERRIERSTGRQTEMSQNLGGRSIDCRNPGNESPSFAGRSNAPPSRSVSCRSSSNDDSPESRSLRASGAGGSELTAGAPPQDGPWQGPRRDGRSSGIGNLSDRPSNLDASDRASNMGGPDRSAAS